MKRSEPKPDAETGLPGAARYVTSHPAPGVFLGRIEGHYAESMLAGHLAGMESALERGPILRGFHDWELMTSYDTACRKEMTTWVAKHRARVAVQHILVRSRMVAMGVATANLILGGDVIISHVKREQFEQALQRAIKGLPDVR